jgi:hypothetical protein
VSLVPAFRILFLSPFLWNHATGLTLVWFAYHKSSSGFFSAAQANLFSLFAASPRCSGSCCPVLTRLSFGIDLGWVVCESLQGEASLNSWVTGSKDSRFFSPNCTLAVISRTRPPGVHWNDCEDINYSSIRFLSLISHVILLAVFHVSAVVPNPVPRSNSFAIAMKSWPS